jgi:hypothetical protein
VSSSLSSVAYNAWLYMSTLYSAWLQWLCRCLSMLTSRWEHWIDDIRWWSWFDSWPLEVGGTSGLFLTRLVFKEEPNSDSLNWFSKVWKSPGVWDNQWEMHNFLRTWVCWNLLTCILRLVFLGDQLKHVLFGALLYLSLSSITYLSGTLILCSRSWKPKSSLILGF